MGGRGLDMHRNRNTWQHFVHTIMHLQIPKMRSNFFPSWRAISFSRRVVHYEIRWLVMPQIRVHTKYLQLDAQSFAFNAKQYFSLFVTQNVFIRRVIGQHHRADFFFVGY